MSDNKGFEDLILADNVKKKFLENLLEKPDRVAELYRRSSKEDVETLFQKECSSGCYRRFLDQVKSKLSEEEFIGCYSLHMSDAQGGFGGFGVHSFLTVAKRQQVKQ
ncbi:hypothetical protein [Exiguobacterium sp. s133]|uniref:hypothetical protein n=1 Tax=Exiguobacterium sp. s133 TaxID=2751213 RepID=UPI001BEA4C27|nr:hypothetical protein [Exiguobacterium sp. s133]